MICTDRRKLERCAFQEYLPAGWLIREAWILLKMIPLPLPSLRRPR